jgi:hypothetical protein
MLADLPKSERQRVFNEVLYNAPALLKGIQSAKDIITEKNMQYKYTTQLIEPEGFNMLDREKWMLHFTQYDYVNPVWCKRSICQDKIFSFPIIINYGKYISFRN